MKDQLCPKCAATQIMADVEMRDWGKNGSHPLRVYIQEREPPQHGLIWKQVESSGDLRAWICAACGYTELHTSNFAALYDSYRKAQQ